jgi:hypothetical protein
LAEPNCSETVPLLESKSGESGHIAACLVTE